MSLDETKLRNLRRTGGKAVAACPACRENGQDHRGDHLFIAHSGRFGCVLYKGSSPAACTHRRRIWQLAGGPAIIGSRVPKRVIVLRPAVSTGKIRVLGRFGRSIANHACAGDEATHNSVKDQEQASEASEARFGKLTIAAFQMFNVRRFQLFESSGRPSVSGTTLSELKRALSLVGNVTG
jgi:hypothetical protein